MITARLRCGPGLVNSWDAAESEAYFVKRETSDSGTIYASRTTIHTLCFTLHSRSPELLPILLQRLEEGYWKAG